MKLTIILLLLSLSATAQFKTVINPDKRIATLKNDTLFIHLPIKEKVEDVIKKKRFITFNGVTYKYKVAYYDKSLFWIEQQQSNKKEIRIFKN